MNYHIFNVKNCACLISFLTFNLITFNQISIIFILNLIKSFKKKKYFLFNTDYSAVFNSFKTHSYTRQWPGHSLLVIKYLTIVGCWLLMTKDNNLPFQHLCGRYRRRKICPIYESVCIHSLSSPLP